MPEGGGPVPEGGFPVPEGGSLCRKGRGLSLHRLPRRRTRRASQQQTAWKVCYSLICYFAVNKSWLSHPIRPVFALSTLIKRAHTPDHRSRLPICALFQEAADACLIHGAAKRSVRIRGFAPDVELAMICVHRSVRLLTLYSPKKHH